MNRCKVLGKNTEPIYQWGCGWYWWVCTNMLLVTGDVYSVGEFSWDFLARLNLGVAADISKLLCWFIWVLNLKIQWCISHQIGPMLELWFFPWGDKYFCAQYINKPPMDSWKLLLGVWFDESLLMWMENLRSGFLKMIFLVCVDSLHYIL